MAKRKIKFISYFAESIQELKKVTWPTFREASHLTVVVIIISAVVAFFLGFFDYIFDQALGFLLH